MRLLPSSARLDPCARDTQTSRCDRQMQVEVDFCPSEIVLSILSVAWTLRQRLRRFFGLTDNAQRAYVSVESLV
jgi:hypothetical protein